MNGSSFIINNGQMLRSKAFEFAESIFSFEISK